MNLNPYRIILIRHGHAEPQQNGVADDQRQLTLSGQEEIRSTAQSLEPLLKGSLVRLWSSPLLRATQSADILAKTLGGQAETKDCLAKADLESFLKETETAGNDTTLIAVGHEPTLSRWIQNLSGISLKLTTGSAVILNKSPKLPHPYILTLWIDPSAQTKSIGRRQPALDVLKQQMRAELQTVFLNLESFQRNPSDPETGHQVRVSLRTLGSLMIFAKPLCEKNARTEALEKTLCQADHWASLRALDVFISHFQAFRDTFPDVIGSSGLLRALRSRRLKLRNALISTLNRGEIIPELFGILAWIDSLESPDQPNLEKFAQARFDTLNRKAFRRIGQLDLKDLNAVHELRLRLKTLRYLAEMMEPLHLTDKMEIREVIRLQAQLGKICDWRQDLELLTSDHDLFKDDRFNREADLFTGYLLGCLEQFRAL